MQNRNILVTHLVKNNNTYIHTYDWFEDEEEALEFIQANDVEPIDFLDTSNCREINLEELKEEFRDIELEE